jgi:hypothetical protein
VDAARARGCFDAKLALADAAPEIRDALARALLSDEYASEDEKQKLKFLDEIVNELSMPTDVASLQKERAAAVQRGDMEQARVLTKRILSTRIQGEQSR